MKNSAAIFIALIVGITIGFGAGKMSKPTSESIKIDTSQTSSDTSTASQVAKNSGSSESNKSTYTAKTYYPNGQLKSEVEKSVEMLKTQYESEITSLKIQIKFLESRSMVQQIVKNDPPKNAVTALGALSSQGLGRGGLFQRQVLLPNLFLGGGGLQLKDESIGLGSLTYLF